MSSDGFIQSSLYLEEVKILSTLPSEASGHASNYFFSHVYIIIIILQFTQQNALPYQNIAEQLSNFSSEVSDIHPISLANNVYPSINLDNYRKLSLSLAKHLSNFAVQGWLTTSGCNVMPEWYSILIRYLSGSYLSGPYLYKKRINVTWILPIFLWPLYFSQKMPNICCKFCARRKCTIYY